MYITYNRLNIPYFKYKLIFVMYLADFHLFCSVLRSSDDFDSYAKASILS